MDKITLIRFFLGILVASGVFAWYYYQETRSPEKIFTKAWAGMNTADVSSDFARYFESMRQQHKSGQLMVVKDKKIVPTSSIVEYYTAQYVKYYDKKIENLKKLNPAEDGKLVVALISSSLLSRLFQSHSPILSTSSEIGLECCWNSSSRKAK